MWSRDSETVAKVVEERDFELGAGLGEAEHDVSGDASFFADRPAGDFSLGDDGANVVFAGVGVEGNFRPLEHAQQLVLVGVEALEEPVERGVSGSAFEDAVEAGREFGGALWAGGELERLELPIEPPDHSPRDVDGVALPVVGGNELVDEALGVNPTQSVVADAELPGVIGEDDGGGGQPILGADGAPERPFAGHAHRIGGDPAARSGRARANAPASRLRRRIRGLSRCSALR